MRTLYLKEQGSKLGCSGRRLIVTKDDEQLLAVPIHRLSRVVLIGRVQVTAHALAFLLDRRVPLIMTTIRGRLRGVLCPPDTPHVSLRKKQYALAGDSKYILQFCRDLVAARAESTANVIRRYLYNHPKKDLAGHVEQILDYAKLINQQPDIDSLRGIEGIISREYFKGLVKIFESLGFDFVGRIRRPPTDPVNAVLSYTYVLLTEHTGCCLQTTRLDIFLGFMHFPNRNAPALTLDFVEQFRQPIADRFVMLLFNKRILQKQDFTPGPMNSVNIAEPARKKLLIRWEEFLDTPQKLLADAPAITPRQLLYEKAEQLEEAVKKRQPFSHYRLCL